MFALLLILKSALACDDPTALIGAAQSALLEVRLDDTKARLAEAEAAFACSEFVTPALLARMWQIDAVRLSLTGKAAASDDAFAASAQADPDVWDAAYGPDLRARYEAAAARPSPIGHIALIPPLENYQAMIDGRVTYLPAVVPAGLHLIQIGPPEGPAAFARLFFLPDGENLEIETGLVEQAPAPVAEVAPEPTKKRRERPSKDRSTDGPSGGLSGIASLGSAVMAVTAGPEAGDSFAGAGPRASLGAAYGGRFGAQLSVGFQQLAAAGPEDGGPGFQSADARISFVTGSAMGTMALGRVALRAGPVWNLGWGVIPLSYAAAPCGSGATTCDLPDGASGVPARVSTRSGGAQAEVAVRLWRRGAISVAPAAQLALVSDLERLYPWGGLSIELRANPTDATP